MNLNYSVLASEIYICHQQLHSASAKKKAFHFQGYSWVRWTRRVRFHLLFTSVILSQGFRVTWQQQFVTLVIFSSHAFRVTFSLPPYLFIVLGSIDIQDSVTYHSGYRVDMLWRLSPCVLSIIFLLWPIFKIQFMFQRTGAYRNQWENGIWGNWQDYNRS